MSYGFGLGIFSVLIWLFFLMAGVYSFVLFVKLAHRGIKALDIYIERNRGY